MVERIDLLLSMHVPKTAGSTLWNSLKRVYPEAQRLVVHEGTGRGDVSALTDAERAKLSLVHGHFSFGMHRSFGQASRYLCFLRDPVDRFVSLYYYVRSSLQHPLHAAVMASNMGLAEFAESGLAPDLDNCQTRMLSGRPETHFTRGTEACTDIDLQRALQHIDSHFCFIGLTERFEQGRYLLQRILGRTLPRPVRRNVTTVRPTVEALDAHTRAIIERNSAYDLELYRQCQLRFEAQWSGLGSLRRWRWHLTERLRRHE